MDNDMKMKVMNESYVHIKSVDENQPLGGGELYAVNWFNTK